MSTDCLKLTSYFGERTRVGGQFFADALMETYGAHGVATSVLLRGIGGFGLKHHLRTDQSLTLSEDLPVTAIAVDTRERIEALLPRVGELSRSGLTVLERARLLTDGLDPAAVTEQSTDATKLSIYVGRTERVYRMAAYEAVSDLLYRRGIDGATTLLGVDGTRHGRRERARFFDRNANVPMMLIAVGPGERIARVLPELGGLLRDPLVTVEQVRVCKRDGVLLTRPPTLPAYDEHGLRLWQKLMVYTSEAALHDGEPVHRALVRRLRQSSARGATALRGVWGFHGDHPPHGDRVFQLARHVPVVTTVVDRPEAIAASFDVVDELTREHGLVTVESVPALTAYDGDGDRRGGMRLADPPG